MQHRALGEEKNLFQIQQLTSGHFIEHTEEKRSSQKYTINKRVKLFLKQNKDLEKRELSIPVWIEWYKNYPEQK